MCKDDTKARLLEALEDCVRLLEYVLREAGEYDVEAELEDARAIIAEAKRSN